MRYKVHRLEVKEKTAQEQLEDYLNQLRGEVISVVPFVSPVFLMMGATSRVKFLLIVEKI
jgi:hypothetical protein